jgi:hypothetical protein
MLDFVCLFVEELGAALRTDPQRNNRFEFHGVRINAVVKHLLNLLGVDSRMSAAWTFVGTIGVSF